MGVTGKVLYIEHLSKVCNKCKKHEGKLEHNMKPPAGVHSHIGVSRADCHLVSEPTITKQKPLECVENCLEVKIISKQTRTRRKNGNHMLLALLYSSEEVLLHFSLAMHCGYSRIIFKKLEA